VTAIYADPTGPGDRLSLTLCLAIVVHALVVLGITFVPEEHATPRYDTMEIVLVQHSSSETSEDADYLAQANQQGGGDSSEDVVPATPLNPPVPGENPDMAAAMPSQMDSPTEQAAEDRLMEGARDATTAETQAEQGAISAEQAEALVAEGPAAELPQPAPEPSSQDTARPEPRAARPTPRKLSAAKLISNSFAIASLSASIERRLEASAKRPRRKFISANTKEYQFAAYMEAWRAKVERVGNLNYPDQARRQRLAGNLILEVILRPDGSVEEIILRRSSGHAALDDAAIRIVKLASPYAPFPANFKDRIDRLHITRTWRFLNSYRLSSR
jgi:protein TonB